MDARIARRAVAVALIAGVAAELLFDRVSLGINVPIATLATLALVGWLGNRRPADPLDWWLAGVAAAASLGPALRTDPSVVALDLWLVTIAVGAWSFAVSGVAVSRRAGRVIAVMAIQAGIALMTGFAWLLTRIGADGAFARGTRQAGRAAPVVRGTLIAVPILAGFGMLLGSADAVFGRALDEALRLPDLGNLLTRTAFAAVAAVLVAGPVVIATGAKGLLDPIEDPVAARPAADGTTTSALEEAEAPGAAVRRGATEAVVVLLAVDALFAAFAAVQVVYLFGGADTLATIGMTYSDYARQGYFQLVGVVALAGLLLIGAYEIAGRRRAVLAAGLTLLVLTGVILASAALRMKLYQDAYGWTELRFFVGASIAWLAAGLAIAIVLLLTNRMRWMAHGLAVSAVAVTLSVSAIGPQSFVMDQNVARVLHPELVPPGGHTGFDAEYGLTLGDDTVPALVAVLDRLPPLERFLARTSLETRQRVADADRNASSPFAWNLARERARAALATLPPDN